MKSHPSDMKNNLAILVAYFTLNSNEKVTSQKCQTNETEHPRGEVMEGPAISVPGWQTGVAKIKMALGDAGVGTRDVLSIPNRTEIIRIESEEEWKCILYAGKEVITLQWIG